METPSITTSNGPPAPRIVAALAPWQILWIGLGVALEHADDFAFVGGAPTVHGLLPLVEDVAEPIVVVAGDDPAPVVSELVAARPDAIVVVIADADDPEQPRRALELGARVYVSDAVEAEELASILRGAAEAPYRLVRISPQAPAGETGELTERELQILKAVAQGLPNRSIAERLGVTEQTVKFHLTNVFRKLGVRNRTEAARWAFEHGMAFESVADRRAR